jgi:hypothetical protein
MSQFAPLAITVVVGAFDAGLQLLPHGAVYDKPVLRSHAALSRCEHAFPGA